MRGRPSLASGWFDGLISRLRALSVRMRRRRVLRRLRKVFGKRKLRVAFLVSELAKWKSQSVYDRMRDSAVFEPFVAVHNLTRVAGEPESEQRRQITEKMDYFRRLGMLAVDIQRYGSKRTLSASEMGADIVFYQQPWDLSPELRPWTVASQALTFYVPYALPNHDMIALEIGHKLHRLVEGHIVLNRDFANYYLEHERDFGGGYAAEYLALGHPALDGIRCRRERVDPNGCVIYAPHWTIEYGSFSPKLKYGTFVWNGRQILKYAKEHPEIRWVFKPHPELRSALVDSGFMTKAEVDAYYTDWERIGTACYTADYLGLFDDSKAMITDSGSFLTEYGCTGKPLIRLVGANLNAAAHPLMKRLYAGYYEVDDADRMRTTFDRVLIGGEDPLAATRLKALEALDLRTHDAARAIVDYLTELLGKEKETDDGR